MPTWLISLLQMIVTQAAKELPGLIEKLRVLLAKDNITEDDWKALEAQYRGKRYEDYVPNKEDQP